MLQLSVRHILKRHYPDCRMERENIFNMMSSLVGIYIRCTPSFFEFFPKHVNSLTT